MGEEPFSEKKTGVGGCVCGGRWWERKGVRERYRSEVRRGCAAPPRHQLSAGWLSHPGMRHTHPL